MNTIVKYRSLLIIGLLLLAAIGCGGQTDPQAPDQSTDTETMENAVEVMVRGALGLKNTVYLMAGSSILRLNTLVQENDCALGGTYILDDESNPEQDVYTYKSCRFLDPYGDSEDDLEILLDGNMLFKEVPSVGGIAAEADYESMQIKEVYPDSTNLYSVIYDGTARYEFIVSLSEGEISNINETVTFDYIVRFPEGSTYTQKGTIDLDLTDDQNIVIDAEFDITQENGTLLVSCNMNDLPFNDLTRASINQACPKNVY